VLDGNSMPPPGQQHHVGASAREVAEHASALTRLELELAVLELKRKAAALGIGAGMTVGAVVLGVFAIAFLLAAAAAGLADVLPWWASLLIVAGGLLLVAGILGVIGIGALRRGVPPVPERAIEEAKLTSEAIKS
jgi:membrane protein